MLLANAAFSMLSSLVMALFCNTIARNAQSFQAITLFN
jgi:hypothetical protein